MKNTLEALFGSKIRWRLIKLFLLNENATFTVGEVSKRLKTDGRSISGILTQLENAKFIATKTRQGKKLYSTNKSFPFFNELKGLVIKSNVYPQCESLGKIRNLGNVKLGVISGIFINNPKSKTDLLIVGDNVSKAKMNHLLEDLEAEMGREVNYSLMDSAEFKYRINMFDKFIMELLESPHEIVVNKLQKELFQVKGVGKLIR